MPYRRLPNTDLARLRALKAAINQANKMSPFDLAFSQKLFLRVKTFVPHFEQAISQYNFSKNQQAKIGRLLSEQFKTTRLFVSHFIQVFNFCIIRGEIKPEVRLDYGLDISDKSVPDLGTEQHLITVGKNIIKGEEKRNMTGGVRIYNPSIAIVNVKYEKFLEYYNNHKNLLVTTSKMHDKVTELRGKADELILELWNEIEATYEQSTPEEKRDQGTAYGIVYLLRKHEKEEFFK